MRGWCSDNFGWLKRHKLLAAFTMVTLLGAVYLPVSGYVYRRKINASAAHLRDSNLRVDVLNGNGLVQYSDTDNMTILPFCVPSPGKDDTAFMGDGIWYYEHENGIVYRTYDGSAEKVIALDSGDAADLFAVSGDRHYFAFRQYTRDGGAGPDRSIILYDLVEEKSYRILDGNAVTSLCLSHDGRTLYYCSKYEDIYSLDLQTLDKRYVTSGSYAYSFTDGSVGIYDYSPDGELSEFYTIPVGSEKKSLVLSVDGIRTFAWHASGNYIVLLRHSAYGPSHQWKVEQTPCVYDIRKKEMYILPYNHILGVVQIVSN